jgi:hypothetical protein
VGSDKADVRDVIRRLLTQHGSVTSGQVARAAGVTRQAAHYHLRKLATAGEVALTGRGRGARYTRMVDVARRYSLVGLEEDEVWGEIHDRLPSRITANARSILGYAFTEMLNNAIEHSGGSSAEVLLWLGEPRAAFEIVDDGVGVYRHLRQRLGLGDERTALLELTKGKRTTAPEQHTGEGIFFTSKAVDIFELDANGLRWIVDNVRADEAVTESIRSKGTRVRCALDPSTTRVLRDVFERYTTRDSYEFSRSRVAVRLFRTGDRFVSRSEARRIGADLEGFEEVEIDFAGVEEVGQGFADELFRVWASRHPGTRLIPANMSPAVEFMIRRAGGPAEEGR